MTETVRGKLTRQQLLEHDMRALMNDARFRRFVYCVLMDANVLRGNHGANDRNVLWWDGRRSLGLDILATMQRVDPDALLSVLTEETKTRMETAPNGRRNPDRRDELGSLDFDGRNRNDGSIFLDYGSDGG